MSRLILPTAVGAGTVLYPRREQARFYPVPEPSGFYNSYRPILLEVVKTRYQFRIYPTPAQQSNLAKRFGCCRVVWNDALTYLSRRCYASTAVLNTTAMRTPARIFWWQDDADPNGQTLSRVGPLWRRLLVCLPIRSQPNAGRLGILVL
ncbi:helix-turn-helix domain-containing protein [Parathermosynechococcus lividus]